MRSGLGWNCVSFGEAFSSLCCGWTAGVLGAGAGAGAASVFRESGGKIIPAGRVFPVSVLLSWREDSGGKIIPAGKVLPVSVLLTREVGAVAGPGAVVGAASSLGESGGKIIPAGKVLPVWRGLAGPSESAELLAAGAGGVGARPEADAKEGGAGAKVGALAEAGAASLLGKSGGRIIPTGRVLFAWRGLAETSESPELLPNASDWSCICLRE